MCVHCEMGGGGGGRVRDPAEKDSRRRSSAEEPAVNGDGHVACAWKSCAAGVIADCVAVCCCPCGVVSILVLAFVRLPWAVARRCVGRGRRRLRRRRMVDAEVDRSGGDMDGILGMGGVDEGRSESVTSRLEEWNDHSALGLNVEDDVWIELGQWGFGRLSFTGIPFQIKGN